MTKTSLKALVAVLGTLTPSEVVCPVTGWELYRRPHRVYTCLILDGLESRKTYKWEPVDNQRWR